MAVPAQTKRNLLLAFLASVAACGLVGTYVLIAGRFGRIEEAVLVSTAVAGAAAILGFASAIPWEQSKWHPIGPVGVTVVAAALAITLYIIWSEVFLPSRTWQTTDAYWRVASSSWVAAIALTHIGLLSLARLHRSHEWVRRLLIVMIGVLSLLVIGILAEVVPTSDTMARGIGVLAIADVCGTIAVPVLHRISTIRTHESQRTTALTLSLTCPRCRLAQELGVGRTRCGGCGLKFLIEIEEDQCPKCGYPLFRLASDACPECGTPIARPPLNPSTGEAAGDSRNLRV